MSSLARPAALAALALAAATAPAFAQGSAPFYRAELAEPVAAIDVIAGGVVFRCKGTLCSAPRSTHRPLRICGQLRAKTPVLVSFAFGDEALDEDALARCNR